jgi:hypothetical protein
MRLPIGNSPFLEEAEVGIAHGFRWHLHGGLRRPKTEARTARGAMIHGAGSPFTNWRSASILAQPFASLVGRDLEACRTRVRTASSLISRKNVRRLAATFAPLISREVRDACTFRDSAVGRRRCRVGVQAHPLRGVSLTRCCSTVPHAAALQLQTAGQEASLAMLSHRTGFQARPMSLAAAASSIASRCRSNGR